MSTLTSRPMSLVHVDFNELYARHLCRHSQFGINAVHLVALFGVWFGIYGIVYWLARLLMVEAWWVPVGMAIAYVAVLAPNTPLRVLVATAAFVALMVAALLALPELPAWILAVYVVAILVSYKIQNVSHRWFPVENDMTEFNKKYVKGSTLFLVLLFYEVPIALNYLVYGRKDWRA